MWFIASKSQPSIALQVGLSGVYRALLEVNRAVFRVQRALSGLFWEYIGFFSECIVLFWKYIGLGPEYVGGSFGALLRVYWGLF